MVTERNIFHLVTTDVKLEFGVMKFTSMSAFLFVRWKNQHGGDAKVQDDVTETFSTLDRPTKIN
jgi:hypothetical protein